MREVPKMSVDSILADGYIGLEKHKNDPKIPNSTDSRRRLIVSIQQYLSHK